MMEFGSCRLRAAVIFLSLALSVIYSTGARAQGGPPMITDDPGTPGNGKWETNLSVAFELRPGEGSYDAPGIDLNYGVGDNIQLTLQGGQVVLDRAHHDLIGGLGGTEAAVKWRFLDQKAVGFDVSMFPRIIFNIVPSSVRRGLADEGTRFQIPFEVAKDFGRFHADIEVGAVGITEGRSEWLYGIVGGYDLRKATTLLAELHGSSRMNFTHQVITLNFGLHQELTKTCALIVSMGHDVSSADEARALVGYFGVQLTY